MHPKPEDDENSLPATDRSPNRLSIDKSKQMTAKAASGGGVGGNHDRNANEKDEQPNLIQLDA